MSGWNGVGAAYAASYAALCGGTIETFVGALGAGSGRTLLDVGSGTGDLAAALGEEGWLVTGCEPESTMRAISRAQHPNLQVIGGGLPRLPFAEGRFDCVTANFVLNHVDDPRASAAEMMRVAASRAVLVASTWTASPSWFWVAVRERAALDPASGERLPADKDFDRTADGLRRMLHESGWQQLEVAELQWTWRVDRDALWASVGGGVAGAGAFFMSLGEAERARFRRAFDEICGERAVDGAMPLEHSAAVVTGRAG